MYSLLNLCGETAVFKITSIGYDGMIADGKYKNTKEFCSA